MRRDECQVEEVEMAVCASSAKTGVFSCSPLSAREYVGFCVLGRISTHADIIKADARGRIRYTEAHKREVLEAFEQSGLSDMQFSRWWDTARSRLRGGMEGSPLGRNHDGAGMRHYITYWAMITGRPAARVSLSNVVGLGAEAFGTG